MKVSAVKKTELPLSDDSNRLGEPIVIAITCGTYSQELVVHRPVGSHDLNVDDWVLTPIAEVEPLLAMAVDPSKPAKDSALSKLRVEYLVGIGKYLKTDNKLHYPKEIWEGRSLADANAAAKEAWRAARDEAWEKYLAECAERKSNPKKNWRFGQVESHFLPEEVKTYESKLREELKTDPTFQAQVQSLGLNAYRTLTGPFQDRPQVAIDTKGTKFTRYQMVDQIKKNLILSMSPSLYTQGQAPAEATAVAGKQTQAAVAAPAQPVPPAVNPPSPPAQAKEEKKDPKPQKNN